MKKILSVAMCIAIMLSLVLETFAVSTDETTDTVETTENSADNLVSYNGTIEELPDYIENSYNENEKAESIDIYDEDPFSFTTNNTDGTKTVEIFQKPIKYIENEEIKFIDTKLEELSTFDKLSSEYIYECTKAPVKSFFPTRIKDGISINNEEYEIEEWIPTDLLPNGYNTRQPINSHGFTNVHHFYTKRILIILSALYKKIVKNKLAPPFKTVEFDIMYGEGISKVGSLVDLAVELNVIQKTGSWFSYNDEKIGQGKENAKQFLKDNPEIYEEIENMIKEKLSNNSDEE